jgi:Domain of unknown function DUF1828
MKHLICDVFCASLEVRSVPAGYAVSTPYSNADGDPLLIYFVRDERQRWRLEDDGTQVPLLEANGVDLSGKARGEAFDALLDEYGVELNTHARTLCSPPLSEEELGAAAVRFVGLLLRLQDLALLSPQIVRSTFREDALTAIHKAFDGRADVSDQAELSAELSGQEADVVIRSGDAPPVGIFFATSEERALQALVVKMEMDKYREIATSIILLLEYAKTNPVKPPTLGLAMARLDAVVSFREAQQDTLERIAKAARLQQSGRLQ